MRPDLWGRCAWKLIHLITLDYPINPTIEEKNHYYDFFNSLQYVLPCDKCRYNLKQHYKRYPLTNEILSSRSNLVKWGIDLHNIVNYYTGKPMLTYKQALDKINDTISNKSKNNTYLLIFVIIVIIIIIIIIYHFYKNKNI